MIVIVMNKIIIIVITILNKMNVQLRIHHEKQLIKRMGKTFMQTITKIIWIKVGTTIFWRRIYKVGLNTSRFFFKNIVL